MAAAAIENLRRGLNDACDNLASDPQAVISKLTGIKQHLDAECASDPVALKIVDDAAKKISQTIFTTPPDQLKAQINAKLDEAAAGL